MGRYVSNKERFSFKNADKSLTAQNPGFYVSSSVIFKSLGVQIMPRNSACEAKGSVTFES